MTNEGTPQTNSTPIITVGLELGKRKWVACIGDGRKQVVKEVKKPTTEALLKVVRPLAEKLAATPSPRIVILQEAGRQGFSVHRPLVEIEGVESIVADSSSIEVARKRRRNKTDKLDAKALDRLLRRYVGGETQALKVCQVPSDEQDDLRRCQRNMKRLKKERSGHSNRIFGLLARHGIELEKVPDDIGAFLDAAVDTCGRPIRPYARLEIRQNHERYLLAHKHVLEEERVRFELVPRRPKKGRLTKPKKEANVRPLTETEKRNVDLIQRLMSLNGVGAETAWTLVTEVFGWRTFRNRREVAAMAGLAPTIFSSSTIERPGGISKSGNAHIRWLMIEVAWCWLRFQPESLLSRWYQSRFAGGTSRQRRTGIVAVARRLLVDLWRYVDQGVIPVGAVTGS
jgi:transposase